MKAVFSFWSKPYFRSIHKGHAGFPSEHYFKVALELAVLTARDHFDTIELVTDTEGYAIIEKLGIQFDSVSLALNDIADIPANLWCFGKLKAYSIQKEPFVHLDYDLFLLKPLRAGFLEKAIICQSVEPFLVKHYGDYYLPNLEQVFTFPKLPNAYKLLKDTPLESQKAYNTGLVGGTNWKALTAYAKMAMKVCRDNLAFIRERYSEFQLSEMNVVFEQYTLMAFAKLHNIEVTPLLESVVYDNEEVAEVGLVHLIASSKSDILTCENMEKTLIKRKAAKLGVLLDAQ
jgi:hypothetical protein